MRSECLISRQWSVVSCGWEVSLTDAHLQQGQADRACYDVMCGGHANCQMLHFAP